MGKLGRQAQVSRRKAKKAAAKAATRQRLLDGDEGEPLVEDVESEKGGEEAKPSDALKGEEEKYTPPVMPDNPTFRQMQDYHRARSRACMFTPASAYASATHQTNPVRGLSTADKKLRRRVLKALRLFGKDTPIDDTTPNGRLLLGVLKAEGTMDRLGIQIDTSTESGGEVEDATLLPEDDEATDPQIEAPEADAQVKASGLKLTPAQRGAVTLAKAAAARMVCLENKGRGKWCASDQEPLSTGEESNCVSTRTINSLVKAGILATDEQLEMEANGATGNPSVHLTPLGSLY